MFAAAIDRTDHRRNGHAALTGDFLKTVPKLVFEADTRFVTADNDRTFYDSGLHLVALMQTNFARRARVVLRWRVIPIEETNLR